jgi:putative transposase
MGWRRAAKGLRREGWKVNNKRVQRLWREEGLRVPYRRRKGRHRGVGTAVGAMCPIVPNALWAMGFRSPSTSHTSVGSDGVVSRGGLGADGGETSPV